MEKVSVSLPQGDWGSIKTKYPPNSDKVRFTDFTGTSKNFDTENRGAITKRFGGVNFNASLLSSAPQDQYEAIFSNGTHHLLTMNSGTLSYSAGGGIFNTVTAGYSSNGNMEFALYQDRVYLGNGIDAPQVYDKTTSYGGVTYTAPKTKAMGAQVPSAPSAALRVDSTTSQVPAGAHTYKVTYLYYGSEESNGSAATSVVTNDGTHTSNTITLPVGGYGVSARKIYRDNNDANWALVTTVSDNTTTSYIDTAASTIGTLLPTDNGLPPTFSLCLQKLDRIWAAGVASNTSILYYSQAGLPDLFSATGYILCNPKDPITGLAEFNNKVMVFNRNSIGYISGLDSLTFAYVSIPGQIGCVDNRSIQLRTKGQGIPTIMWLSDKGYYEFDGSSVNYISDDIEDQVNLNIQQASQVKGKNTEDTQADFQAGTSTSGITITSGGLVTQNTPQISFQVDADYELGTNVNMVTKSTSNSMSAVLGSSFPLASGTLNNSQISGSNLILATSTDFTPTDNTGATQCRYANAGETQKIAQKITVPRAGTLNSASVIWNARTTVNDNPTISIYSDFGGFPNTALYTGSAHLVNGNNQTITDSGISLSLTAGQSVWVVVRVQQTASADSTSTTAPGPAMSQTSTFTGVVQRYNQGGFWESFPAFSGVVAPLSMCCTFGFSVTPNSLSGTWTSSSYDTLCTTTSPTSVTQSGSYPTSCSAVSFIEGSNDQSSWDVSFSVANTNGSTALSLSNRRYWRVRSILSTTDDLRTPSVGTPSIVFPTTATWTSPAIDCTSDITALNSLTYGSNVPAGTTLTVQVATSSDNVSYSSFGAFGSATPARYVKIKATITTDAGDTVSASVNGFVMNWTVVSTQTSPAIDTSNRPVGWELFQSTFTSGVTFQARTATTSGGLSAASWTTVTNGAYITATVNRFIQWKAVLTSTVGSIASVDSVTINWFISQTNSIRVCSIFYGRSYYMAAAEFGNTTNNILFKLDEFNRWRVYRGINVGTMSFFFNQPYYGSSTSGQVVKWLTGSTDSGTNIELDVQTAAINYGDQEHNKVLRQVRVIGKNTGATFTPQYSTNAGLTWKSLVNPMTGLSTFTVSSDNGLFDVRLCPIFASDNATGITHIFRLISSDSNACEIHAIKLTAWIRHGEI